MKLVRKVVRIFMATVYGSILTLIYMSIWLVIYLRQNGPSLDALAEFQFHVELALIFCAFWCLFYAFLTPSKRKK